MDIDFLLEETCDLVFENGDIKIGEAKMQNVLVVLSTTQGNLKSDPIVGINLLKRIRGKENKEKIRKDTEIALERVGIKFEDIKEEFAQYINRKK